jgi:acyl transferase domain-containing protein/NAD(P)H-dependent flavin oxidoreductase YrpB (nitropropane dioxygenase family)/NADP-dependent 3-hydroxy acid dehydrogenase YdfG
VKILNDVCVVSPFEQPDVRLALETIRAGAYPFLHLGNNVDQAAAAVAALTRQTPEPFGVIMTDAVTSPLLSTLPDAVTRVVVPFDWAGDTGSARRIDTVRSLTEAATALDRGATALALKGSEGAGHVGADSSFVLFLGLRQRCLAAGVDLFIYGGAGVHTSAAYFALGARGVILDSQIVLLPECHVPKVLRTRLAALSGNETGLIDGFRHLRWPTMPRLPEDATRADLSPYLGGLDPDANILPLGQDFALAGEYLHLYGRLHSLVHAIKEAAYGHLRQAQATPAVRPGSELAERLGLTYPIVQGPMARVSDTPAFLGAVAASGALPTLALGLSSGAAAQKLLEETAAVLGDRPWAVGLLGFADPAQFQEQATRIIEAAQPPTAVVIAGGRPVQARRFDSAGIAAFLHVPSANLLDIYLDEGIRNFIFEGRESGGHVGPAPSTVLWEKQLIHLLNLDDPTTLCVLFAGGLYDSVSAAFVTIMAASLAARGARIGLLLGTAYLLTDEAVETGAITPLFQELAKANTATVLLESVKGQETRALPTPFVDYFAAERARIRGLDLDDLARRAALEELNLGRARVASKGVDRVDRKTEVSGHGAERAWGDQAVSVDATSAATPLVSLDQTEQLNRGLYMAGEVVGLIDRTRSMADLNAAVGTCGDLIATLTSPVVLGESDQQRAWNVQAYVPSEEPIAIVGLAGIFPQAANADEFWRNIVTGVDAVIEVPATRWDHEVFYRPDTTDTDFVISKWGAFLSAAEFDPVEFGITPQSVSSIEPAQLLSLVVAKRALQDAGYADFRTANLQDTSVIFGTEAMGELASAYGSRPGIRSMFGDLPTGVANSLPRVTEDSFAGILSNVTAGRIANRLNCGGRNFTVDAACASSLASLDIACQELWADRANMVLCGGADLHNSIFDYIMFSATHALSKDGRCSTFDESGNGMTLGEGVGAVVLKRLSDAERDGDKIYALIRGVHGSSDGRSLGLTAPHIDGQTAALRRAYRMAGVLPGEVGLIEAHGTGTAVGDRTELGALTRVLLDGGALPGQAYAGSVKTQIGHTKCAAGIAGLIRATLSTYYAVIPPTLHLQKPVRNYVAGRSPLAFNASGQATPWNSTRRIVGLSGFGFGGTNFHAILQNYTPEPAAGPILRSWPAELFLFRGPDLATAKVAMGQVKALYEANHYLSLTNVAYSLATASEAPVQVALVAKSWSDLLTKLDAALDDRHAPGVFPRAEQPGKVAFLFSGQGSQRVNMARDLFVVFPHLRTALNQHPAYHALLFPPSVFTDQEKQAQRDTVTDTQHAQPLLGFVDLAMAQLLNQFGIKADLVSGHSYGELPALAYAGVIDPADLPELSRQRAEAILGAVGDDPGRMVALGLSSDEVAALLANEEGVWAVNLNSPRQTVVGGTSAAIDRLIVKLSDQGIVAKPLNVACAFHTPLLAGADKTFATALRRKRFSEPQVPVWSNTTAAVYPTQASAIKQRLAEHLISPVRFTDELKAMYEAGARVFIEAGPGGVLTGLARENLGDDVVAIQTERAAGHGLTTLLEALGRYIATGRSIAVDQLFAGRGAQRLDLTTPDDYRQSRTTWMIDGLEAVPAAAWREQGDQHKLRSAATAEELRQFTQGKAGADLVEASNALGPDELVHAYLQNVRTMLDDQRDIMLGYLGYADAPAATRRAVASAPAAAAPTDSVGPAAAAETTVETVVETDAVLEEDELDDGSILRQLKDLSPDDVHDIIIEVVGEKTGYPIDMLGLDMDLEADLSIDSIKRLEIIGSLNQKVVLPSSDVEAGDADAASALEHMASIKTLRGMIAWLQGMVVKAQDDAAAGPDGGGTTSQEAGPTARPAVAPAPTNDEPVEVIRLVLTAQPYPLAEDRLALNGKRFALAGGGGDGAAAVTAALAAIGAAVNPLAPGDTVADDTLYDGLVLLNVQGAPVTYTVKDLFHLLKAVDLKQLEWLVVFDDTVGHLLAADDLTDVSAIQGFSGLVKTLQLEYPQLRARVVDGRQDFDLTVLPEIVVAELTDPERFPAVAYDGPNRLRLLPVAQPTAPGASADEVAAGAAVSLTTLLDDSSVVLVLGGAQGISPTLVARVAQDQPCHFVLVGRTPRNLALVERFADQATAGDIQKHLIEADGLTKPKQIQAQVQAILKARHIEAAITQVAATGADVDYVSADVHDQAAFRALIADVKSRYGRIDAVFHAAGILEDKLFKDKTWASFEQVYTTKTGPLQVIVDELFDDLKALVLFSSVAAAFGNRGQSDYAAANSVFDTIAFVLSQRQSPVKTVAIAWGPWEGAGMVSATLEAEMRRRGLHLIDLTEGSEFFCRELTVGREPYVLAIAGRRSEFEAYGDQVPALG